MIIWRGFGILVLVVTFGCSLAAQLLSDKLSGTPEYWETHAWPLATALASAGAIVWAVGMYLARRPVPSPHDFFFIPMKYWGILLGAIGVFVVVTNKVPGPSKARATESTATQATE